MPQRVLVVEDEQVVLTFIETVLKRHGVEVLTARSAGEARQILAQQPDGADLCLVVDVVLDQESGIALAQDVIRQHPNYRVLLVSGFTDEVLLPSPEHEERIAFLRKPFSGPELLNAIDAVCHV